jgi:hypothetical protein
MMSNWNKGRDGYVLRGCLVALLALLGASSPSKTFALPAQARSASLSGVLQDPTGRRLPHVPVVLIDTGTGSKIQQESDDSGRFIFSEVPAGEYRLEVQRSGFLRDQGPLKLVPGQRVARTFTLQVGSIAETVMVWMSKAQANTAPAAQSPANRPNSGDPCGPSAPAGCISPPVKLVNALPVYPPAHLKNEVSGQVVVVGRVGTDGRLEALEPEAGSDPAFTNATLEALQLWRYSPARLGGVPVSCRIVVTTIFGK